VSIFFRLAFFSPFPMESATSPGNSSSLAFHLPQSSFEPSPTSLSCPWLGFSRPRFLHDASPWNSGTSSEVGITREGSVAASEVAGDTESVDLADLDPPDELDGNHAATWPPNDAEVMMLRRALAVRTGQYVHALARCSVLENRTRQLSEVVERQEEQMAAEKASAMRHQEELTEARQVIFALRNRQTQVTAFETKSTAAAVLAPRVQECGCWATLQTLFSTQPPRSAGPAGTASIASPTLFGGPLTSTRFGAKGLQT